MVRGEDGVTLVELLVALSLLLIGLVLFSSVYFVTQNATKRQFEIGDTGNQIGISFVTMERQVRSGYVARLGGIAGAWASATLYTEPSTAASNTRKCWGWALDQVAVGTQTLYAASWSINATAPAFPSGWTRMAAGIRNQAMGIPAGSTFTAKFVSGIAASPVGVALGVDLYVDSTVDTPGGVQVPPTRYSSTFTARNARRAGLTIPGGSQIAGVCS